MNPSRPVAWDKEPDEFQNKENDKNDHAIPRLCPDWISRECRLVLFWKPLLTKLDATFWRQSGISKKFILDRPQNSTLKISQNFPLWIYSGWYCPRLSPDSVQNGHSQIRTSGTTILRERASLSGSFEKSADPLKTHLAL